MDFKRIRDANGEVVEINEATYEHMLNVSRRSRRAAASRWESPSRTRARA